ncbi:hypothetical protein H5410_038005 [Solanum commersonii]|uniref:Cell differentiation protein rcd1 n=1 Tax=Solanum commersonii TaxID=4109 RepID=A0A9J5Y9I7_SOLCO|nr:hypothetical protein H5410_038005 [Solanum commersonii]
MENFPESPFLKSTLISSSSLCNISSSPMDMQKNPHDLDGLTANQLVLLLLDGNLREEVMYELIKVMAKNQETRKELIEAKIPCYFYPFLKPSGDDKPLEYLRLTILGVLGAVAKFDDPYGPKVLHFFLEMEVVPSCLECMDLCNELSWKVATLIVMKILMQEKGMSYCSATPERFYSIVQVLYRVVQKITKKPCLLHLMYVIQCFLSLSDVFKFIGPSEAFIHQVPPQLFDNTFKDILRDDHQTAWMLQVLHFNVYGRLFSPE